MCKNFVNMYMQESVMISNSLKFGLQLVLETLAVSLITLFCN
jgi:hypothetical protein